MALWDRVTRMLALEPWQEPVELTSDFPSIEVQMARIQRTDPPLQPASVTEALGIPAIQRAVTLISHTVGSLSMQGWRDGSPMVDTPPVLARPNPYQTPVDCYRQMAFNLASYGEDIMWIAKRDANGYPLSLVVVPPYEVTVTPNYVNRFKPTYSWTTNARVITGTRYSLANPEGAFVHVMYHSDAQGLRGLGPLQMCGLAVSVSVEAQNWAAGFFAGGGVPPLVIKSAVELDGTVSEDDGLTEAQRLKVGWMSGDNNTPKVIDPLVESVDQFDFNPQGAQMLDARQANNGDAARMFGIPGTLLEYNMPGSSLTYQSVPDVWIEFLRGCLQPSYLEPIEAHMSDLLPRSQSGRFNTKGLQRADIKTRYDTYQIGIPLGVIDVDQAKREEGYLPGDIETMPVAPSPPAAVFQLHRQVRCDGQRMVRGVAAPCNALLAEAGPFVGTCRRCGKHYAAAA